MERYKGYTVLITWFVFKGSEMLQADEFVSARLMMSCCTADLTPAGLLCNYDKAAELKADSCVTVEGTLCADMISISLPPSRIVLEAVQAHFFAVIDSHLVLWSAFPTIFTNYGCKESGLFGQLEGRLGEVKEFFCR